MAIVDDIPDEPPEEDEDESQWETPEGDFVAPIGPPVAPGDFDGDGIPDEYDPDHYEISEDEETEIPTYGIDPSGEGDVVQIISDPQFDYQYSQIPTPNFLTEPSPFADLITTGNVDLMESGVLVARSDEGTTSNVYIKIREGTRVTFAVKLDYQNKAIDRSTVFPNDWSEEFDLVKLIRRLRMHGISLYQLLNARKRQSSIQLASYRPIRLEFNHIIQEDQKLTWNFIENMDFHDYFHFAFLQRFSRYFDSVDQN